SIYLTDMSGDGLTDLARIRNGEVCYWPNLGYGRFGAKVTMDNAPWFDAPDLFNQRRIRLADVDGTGVTDIIYLGRDGVHIYLNQSGNGWSDAHTLNQFPRVDNLSSVMVVDLLGNGTACMVWSSPLPGDAGQQMRYIDLMGGQKPHLLVTTKNNLGAETRVEYASSTKFYLDDKKEGKPWITRLPFPVHVVEGVETYDRISRNRFVTRYAYHHGYFDGTEREFHGFGMVEQWDTENFAALSSSNAFPTGDNVDAASHVPPVYTKTWFHTGVYVDRNHISNFFAGLMDENDQGEYYREPAWRSNDAEARKRLLDDTILPEGLTIDEERGACRALKGSMLRQEIYALDGTDKEPHPYTVTEQNFSLRLLQPQGGDGHAVFFSHARESISYHYERNPNDPRVTHALTLEADDFGNILRSITVGYARADVLERQPEQSEMHLTLTLNRFVNRDDEPDWRRIGVPVETRTYEVVRPPAATLRFTWEELHDLVVALVPLDKHEPPLMKTVPYEQWDWRVHWNSQAEPGGSVNTRLRLIEHVRTLYRPDDLGVSKNDPLALLPLGTVESLALPGESYKLAFTPGLVNEVAGGRVTDAMLESEGRYVHSEGDSNWWIPSGRIFHSPGSEDTSAQELDYARRHFFLPHRYRDPFHTSALSTETFVRYDDYDLLVKETTDALKNRVTVGERKPNGDIDRTKPGNDYRVLQPRLLMDPNRNRAAVAFDALGMVVGTAVMGKPEDSPQQGDLLDTAFRTDPTQAEIDFFFANPKGPRATSLLGNATTRIIYDLTAYWREPDLDKKPPTLVATLVRETHANDPIPAGGLKIQASLSYSDGFGREIQKKIQAEPGPVPRRDPATGRIVIDADGQPEMTQNGVSPRWVGSGWTVFNNKGKPVRQYEPFFTDTHNFEFDVRIGVSPVLFYDPVERVVATLHPNHTWEKVVFNPWRQLTYDVNDTVKIDPRTDEDISGYVLEYFKQVATNPSDWKTWLKKRGVDPLNPPQETPGLEPEKKAAVRTLVHADTPTVAHFDTLGRTFLTVAHNRFKYSNTSPADPPAEEFYPTRILFDIEGNQREVMDAKLDPVSKKGRIVMRYDYDMLGNRVHQASMEAGERWMLNDVAGKSIRAWDSRGHQFRSGYDPLRRPTESYLSEGGSAEMLVERTIYGEAQANPEAKSLRGKVFQVFDQAGVATNDEYDFKGNLLRSRRQLAMEYKTTLNWPLTATPDLLEEETFTSSTTFDALNRSIQVIAPHSSRAGTKLNIIQPGYNGANLLERVEVWLGQTEEPLGLLDPATATQHAVKNIDYNAKGQRLFIEYGSGSGADGNTKGVNTTYEYDPLTFRLTRLETLRGMDHLQDLFYTYDPSGNITTIRDDAQQTIYFNGGVVRPDADYTYDAVYRLIQAKGREHIGQAQQPWTTWNDEFRIKQQHPNDGKAMRTYAEQYEYDEVGNFLRFIHHASGGDWVRDYTYEETSLIDPDQRNNRLSKTSIGSGVESYTYNAHGSMTSMPHLPEMDWDFVDQLQSVDLGSGGRAYYVYDSGGQRARKVIELSDGRQKEERLYIGGFEVHRKYNGNSGEVKLERETLHIMDDKQRIALVETRTKGDDPAPEELIRYQLGNHLGSASLEVDDKSQIISYEEYHPYGSTSYQAVKSQTETPKRYRYTGKERDEGSGLYYHGGRYYASWLSRWTAPDPLSLEGGLNLYSYVECRPTIAADPTGRIIWLFVAAVVVIATLTTVSESGAPSSEEDVERLRPSISEGEFAAHTAVTGVSMAIGGGTGSAVMRHTGSRILGGAAGGGMAGLTSGPASLAVSDIARGQASSASEYGRQTLVSTGGGTLLGAGFGAVSRVVRGPAPRPTMRSSSGSGARRTTSRRTDPPGSFRDSAGRLRDARGRFMRDPARQPAGRQSGARPSLDVPQGPLSDVQLHQRAQELSRQLVIEEFASRGVTPSEALIRRVMGQSTVSIVQTEVGGQTTRIVTTTSSRHHQLLSRFLGSGEQLGSEPIPVSWSGGRFAIHAEQVGVNDAIQRGAVTGRIATSNRGCGVCQSLLSEEFPGFTHVNPAPTR
ncbi:MAG: hypothetical protein GKC09_11120, partial [Methanosarcinales archaeon]|nr:hypothetical protein [Methanosarcinales archaeon]